MPAAPVGLFVSLFCIACCAWSQAPFPVKPIRVVVPNPTGGIDQYLRYFQPRVAEFLGQPLVIESRPGASGAIGAQNVAKSAPDGYSLLFCTSAQIVSNPFLIRDLPYDPIRDLTPVSMLVEPADTTLSINVSIPANNVRELIDYGKKNPGKLSYGSSGVGSIPHFTGELFKLAAGIDMLHVPYKGVAQIMPELMAGRVDVAFAGLGFVGPTIASGKVRALAVLDPRRYARLPEVPSIVDTLPGFRSAPLWFSVFGPAGLPRSVAGRLHEAFAKTAQTPEVRATLEERGMKVIVSSPEELAASIKSDIELTARLVKQLGLKPE
ncbi:MAG: tripartite tricarboxylate transporter substrate binding protein [Betaproteobacteria bacterium]|nr:tripartite tricarboxylate transporter substrate binding protein [Betaproteobacteria bacterium]